VTGEHPSRCPNHSAGSPATRLGLGLASVPSGLPWRWSDAAGDNRSVAVQGPNGPETIRTRTRIWAASVQASPLARILAAQAGVETDRAGRIPVELDCTLPGHAEVFAIGDMVSLSCLPGVAQRHVPAGTARIFDFMSQALELMHMLVNLFSPRGIPADYRHMQGFGVNTYKWTDANTEGRMYLLVPLMKVLYRSAFRVSTSTSRTTIDA
jgi:hypothetical protein